MTPTNKDLYDVALALDKLRQNTHAAMRIEEMVNVLDAFVQIFMTPAKD